MPIRGGWYVAGKVLLTEMKGDISDDEFLRGANNPEIIPAMEASPATHIHFILRTLDESENRQIPSLKIAGQSPLAQHPKVGWVLLVNYQSNKVLRMIIAILAQLTNLRYRFVDTLEEAISFLQDVDLELPAHFPPYEDIHWFNFVNWD